MPKHGGRRSKILGSPYKRRYIFSFALHSYKYVRLYAIIPYAETIYKNRRIFFPFISRARIFPPCSGDVRYIKFENTVRKESRGAKFIPSSCVFKYARITTNGNFFQASNHFFFFVRIYASEWCTRARAYGHFIRKTSIEFVLSEKKKTYVWDTMLRIRRCWTVWWKITGEFAVGVVRFFILSYAIVK